MTAQIRQFEDYRKDPDMLGRIERDAEVLEAARRLNEALFDVAAGVMTVARGRIQSLIAEDVRRPFTKEELTAKLLMERERQANQLVNQTEGQNAVNEIAKRIATEYKIEDTVVIDRIIDVAQAIFKAMMRAEADRLAVARKAQEAAETAEAEDAQSVLPLAA